MYGSESREICNAEGMTDEMENKESGGKGIDKLGAGEGIEARGKLLRGRLRRSVKMLQGGREPVTG